MTVPFCYNFSRTPNIIQRGELVKKKIVIAILAIALINLSLVLHCSRYYSTACDSFYENAVKGSISNQINIDLAEYLYNNNINYSEIAKINYDIDGKITSITVDSIYLNIAANELSQTVFNSIKASENEFGIPIGNITGSKLLSGRGPKIKVRITPIGSVAYKINSQLLSGGINQTLHRISLEFDVIICCLAPFHEAVSTIRSEIIIAESLIIGEVPEVLVSPAR